MNSGYLDKIIHADCREHLGRLSGLTDLLDNYWSGSHAGDNSSPRRSFLFEGRPSLATDGAVLDGMISFQCPVT